MIIDEKRLCSDVDMDAQLDGDPFKGAQTLMDDNLSAKNLHLFDNDNLHLTTVHAPFASRRRATPVYLCLIQNMTAG